MNISQTSGRVRNQPERFEHSGDWKWEDLTVAERLLGSVRELVRRARAQTGKRLQGVGAAPPTAGNGALRPTTARTWTLPAKYSREQIVPQILKWKCSRPSSGVWEADRELSWAYPGRVRCQNSNILKYIVDICLQNSEVLNKCCVEPVSLE